MRDMEHSCTALYGDGAARVEGDPPGLQAAEPQAPSLDALRGGLSAVQQRLLHRIFAEQQRNGSGVRTRVLHAEQKRSEVRTAVEQLGGTIVEENGLDPDKRYDLTFLGVLLTNAGTECERLLARCLAFMRDRYQRDPEAPGISSTDVAARLRLQSDECEVLGQLIRLGNFCGGFSLDTASRQWSAPFPFDIDTYPEISDFGEYIRARALRTYVPGMPIDEAGRMRVVQSGMVQSKEKTMAKHASQQQTARVFLRMPPADARRQLEEQIQKGSNLQAAAIGSNKDLEDAQQRWYRWTDYNQALLQEMFTSTSVADDFSRVAGIFGGAGGLQQEIQGFRSDVGMYVNRLQSVCERLSVYPLDASAQSATASTANSKRSSGVATIFIVHGHDNTAKLEVAHFVGNVLGLKVVILSERPNRGRTLLRKLQDHARDADFAIVLLTPDDQGYPKGEPSEVMPRARQNVILELGYFLAHLGSANVCALYTPGVEIPSDYSGVAWLEMDPHGAWHEQLRAELKVAEFLTPADQT